MKRTRPAPYGASENYRNLGLDGLVILGGNGSNTTAAMLAEEGLNIISLPKTIDNDIAETADVRFILRCRLPPKR